MKIAVAARIDLTSNEAYHWLYGQHPALGYFNHPGMIGWMLALSTSLFGNSPLGVRLLTILSGSLTVWLAYLTGKRLYQEQAGLWAALLVGLVPELFQWGSLGYPDAPLLLFWTGGLWALSHALSGDSPRWWYGAGIFLGLALLSKYHALFFGLGTLIFIVLSPDQRRWLRRPEPYLAGLLALVFLWPTFFWNALHEWRSFRYQLTGRFDGVSAPPRLIHLFPITELVHLTPVVALWAWGAGFLVLMRWRSSSWQDRFAASLAMPVLLGFGAFLLVTRVRGHWTVAAYPGILVLSAAMLLRGGAWGRRLHGATAILLGLGYLALPIILWTVPPAWLSGWSQLARAVRERSPDFVLSPNYHVASEMAYHLRPTPTSDFTAVGVPGNSFEDWWDPASVRGRNAVIVLPVGDSPWTRDFLGRFFDQIGDPERVRVTWFWGKEEEFLLLRARGYHGRS